MSDLTTDPERLQAVLTALLEHEIGESLAQVEDALRLWREGEMGAFEAHAELVRHASRSERIATRIAEGSGGNSRALVRDAFDAGLIEREEAAALIGDDPFTIEPSPAIEDAAPELPEKRPFVEELMGQGPILVHLDARHEGVSVPAKFEGDPKLVLRFGYGLSPAIIDLALDDDTLAGTLTFGGVPFHCVVPWGAVYAAVAEADHRGMVWPEDVPDDVIESLARGAAAEPPPPPPDASGPRRAPHLKLVD